MTYDDASHAPLDILLVEDNPADARLTREALKDVNLASRVSLARDGEEAIAFLRGEGIHAGAPRPDLILLDLHLPGIDGLQVLTAIRRDASLRSIPVVIMTSSAQASGLCSGGETRAQGFLVKSPDMSRFTSTVRTATRLWSKVSRKRSDS